MTPPLAQNIPARAGPPPPPPLPGAASAHTASSSSSLVVAPTLPHPSSTSAHTTSSSSSTTQAKRALSSSSSSQQTTTKPGANTGTTKPSLFLPTPLIMRVFLWKRDVDAPPKADPMPIRLVDTSLAKALGYASTTDLVGVSFVDLVYDLGTERQTVADILAHRTKIQHTTFLRSKAGGRMGPYVLKFLSLRRKHTRGDASRQARPVVTVMVVSCATRDIVFKLNHLVASPSSPEPPRGGDQPTTKRSSS